MLRITGGWIIIITGRKATEPYGSGGARDAVYREMLMFYQLSL